jgi:KDO2-lipid IV(A) lauroyltransferase
LLPLPLNRLVGACLGWIIWRSNGHQRRVTQINLTLCFPHMSRSDRTKLARASLIEAGMLATETVWIWQRAARQVKALVDMAQDDVLLQQARQSGQPIVFATPHLGNWEIGLFALSRDTPVTYLYSIPRRGGKQSAMITGRARLGGIPASMDRAGIRQALGSLRQGQSVCILPDQEPARAHGVFAPFFGVTANTQTLLSSLARRGDAQVLFGFMERLDWRRGWRLRFVAADPNVYDSDKQKAAAAVNRSIETCIRLCPEQYLWSYMRFQLLPAGRRRVY